MFPPRSPSILSTSTPADRVDSAVTSPALLSDSSDSAEARNLQKLPLLDDFAMLILFLRLVVILKNGDAALHGFTDDLSFEPDSFVSDGTASGSLDAIDAIIAQYHDAVAATYHKHSSNHFIAVSDRHSAAVPNAQNQKKHLCGSSHSLQFIKTDEDGGHWPEILLNPECRIIKGPTTLEKHISTVCAYLNDYRNHPLVQSDYSNRFFKYLLTVCWPMIYRRISSWRGLGFIYRLFHCQFDLQNVNDLNWGNTEYDMTHEKRLRRFLSEHKNVVDGLKSVFEWPPVRGSSKGGSIDFRALVSAAKLGKRLYTRNTATEFHHFVFAAFVMLGHSLSLFGKAVCLSTAGHTISSEALQQLFLGLQAHTTLIVCLISSSAFARHMEVLHNSLGLRELVPDFDRREEYEKFGQRMKIWDRDLVTGRCPGNKASGTKADDSSGASDTAMGDFELQSPPEPSTVGDFVRWLKTFVPQFFAQRELQARCRARLDIPIEMPLLTVDCVRYRIPSWDNFKKNIEIALKKTIYPRLPIHLPNVFRLLEEKIMQSEPCDADVKTTVTDIFRGIMEGEEKEITLAPHCEAILAALKFYPINRLAEDRDLAQICEELKESTISVSKLCCPVCWELLHFLKGEVVDQDTDTPAAITVYGCHCTIYPTVLPTGLPKHIYADMMLKFQGHLRRELCELLNASLTDLNRSLDVAELQCRGTATALTVDDPQKRKLAPKRNNCHCPSRTKWIL